MTSDISHGRRAAPLAGAVRGRTARPAPTGPSDAAPLYQRIASVLRTEILELRSPGERIEDQHALCRRFGVSYMTVHKAMEILAGERLISRVPRRGTVVTGGDSREGKTVNLLGIRGWPTNATVRELLRGFRARGGSDVRFQEVEEEELARCVLDLQRRDASPDLLLLNTWCFRELMAAGALQDAAPMVNRAILRQCDPIALRWASSGSRLEGVPICLSPVVMFCNDSLFRKARVSPPRKGWTWNEFIETSRRLTIRNPKLGTVDQYGYVANEDRNRWPILVLQNGGRVLSEDGRTCCLNETKAVEAIQFYRDLIHVHQVSPAPRPYQYGTQLAVSGRIGMFATGFFGLRFFQHANAFTWNVAPLPTGKNRTTYLSTVNLALPNGSKQHDVFRKLAAFLLADESQIQMGVRFEGLPLRRSLWKTKAWRPPINSDIDWEVFLEAVSDGHPLVTKPRQDVIRAITEQLRLVWSNLQPVGPACREIKKMANTMLQSAASR
ncbi:MAG: extracellular solute-binding protein [Verrucomicrobia bacterium]|nr:extracellular solute-binding protein [Verrucomicrobiota bacterium]